jgi:hypothetical protein
MLLFSLCCQVYWLRLSGALVATPTTKDIAGRVELAEPFPVRTLRVPGPFVAPPQGLPTNLVRGCCACALLHWLCIDVFSWAAFDFSRVINSDGSCNAPIVR